MCHFVEVTGEIDLIGIEAHTHQVGRIVPQAFKLLDAIIAAHVPTYVMGVPHHYLGNGCSPATAAYDCYLATIVHSICNLLLVCLIDIVLKLFHLGVVES